MLREQNGYEITERVRPDERVCDDLLVRQISNTESYDKALLSLSTGTLAFSVGFLRQGAAAKHENLLVW